MQFEHKAILDEMSKEAGRAKKLEKKLEVITHGYTTREKTLKASISQGWTAIRVRI